MKLNGIALNKPAPEPAKTFGLNGLKPLNRDEESMIKTEFPIGKNKKLELYLASGKVKTEVPGSKGQNLDFTV
jgi:hypothetical protein